LFTTREIKNDGFGEKTREWDAKKSTEIDKRTGKELGKTGSETVTEAREAWANMTNAHLEKANQPERIDHRSYEAQGQVEMIATKHLGPQAHQMEKRGERTDIGEHNRLAKENNNNVIELRKTNAYISKLQEQAKRLNSRDLSKEVYKMRALQTECIKSIEAGNKQLKALEIKQAGQDKITKEKIYINEKEALVKNKKADDSESRYKYFKNNHRIKAWVSERTGRGKGVKKLK